VILGKILLKSAIFDDLGISYNSAGFRADFSQNLLKNGSFLTLGNFPDAKNGPFLRMSLRKQKISVFAETYAKMADFGKNQVIFCNL